MSANRRLALIAVMFIAALSMTHGTASAHGAPLSPISRATACGPEGGQNQQTAACRAALALSGPGGLAQWDNIRVANVNGRDRETIPDGKLCSGGISEFRGLDLPRADWPSTQLTSGARFTFRYRVTIPHQGSFRMFVSKDTYDPTQPLRWSTLQATPFLNVANPPITNGSYTFDGALPTGKTGRHVIYTIWQTTSTPDTYYSCSDVVFRNANASAGSGTGGGAAAGAASPEAAPSAPPNAGAQAAPPVGDPAGVLGDNPSASASAGSGALRLAAGSSGGGALRLAAGSAAVVGIVVLTGVVGMVSLRRRRSLRPSVSGSRPRGDSGSPRRNVTGSHRHA